MTLCIEQYLQGLRSAKQICDGLERVIQSGEVSTGEPLPPVRQLASALSVNPSTIAAAYRLLRSRGLTYADRRRGTRVIGRGELEGAMLAPTSGLIDLASGNADPILQPDLHEALANVQHIRRSYAGSALLPALHAAVSDAFEQDQISVGRLTAVSGTLDGLERGLSAHLRPGDKIALEDPCFSRSLDLVRASLNLTPLPVSCDDEGLDPSHLWRALREGARAVIVTPRAHNPMGSAMTEERRDDLRAVLRRYPETLIIEDDHAALIVDEPAITLTQDWPGPWAVLRSYAKALGPDLRVAVAAGDPTTIDRIERQQRLGPGWVSYILQSCLAWLLDQPGTLDQLRHATAIYAQRRRAMIEVLAARGIVARGRSGLNVWIPVARELETVQALRSLGYAITPGSNFRIASPAAVRVTTAAFPAERAPQFAEALSHALEAPPSSDILA